MGMAAVRELGTAKSSCYAPHTLPQLAEVTRGAEQTIMPPADCLVECVPQHSEADRPVCHAQCPRGQVLERAALLTPTEGDVHQSMPTTNTT